MAREEAAARRRTIPPCGQVRVLRRRERTGLPPTDPEAEKRAGDPTRKPPASPDRIIRASGGRGDIVLDPSCGCAATPAAAETLGRRRAGIDLPSPAVKPVGQRWRGHLGLFGGRVPRDGVPKRTEIGDRPNRRTHRPASYGRQEGVCDGRLVHSPSRNLTADHLVPRSEGGTDQIHDPKLPQGACNPKKGNLPMEESAAERPVARLRPETPYPRVRR